MRLLISILFSLFPFLATAQPFGIAMGQQIETLKVEKTEQEFVFRIIPPKTHLEMESYLVTATPKQGVCLIKGVGVSHANDTFGFKIKDIAADIRKQVNTTYGLSRLNDFLQPGSIWHEASEWTMAIYKDERAYQFAWGKMIGPTISNNVIEILETVRATNHDTTYVTLQFTFSNYKACKAEMDSVAAKAF